MKLSLIVIRCKNIHTSKYFYQQLGMKFIEEQHANGPVHYSTEINNTIFELYPSAGGIPFDDIRLGFTIQNREALPSSIPTITRIERQHSTVYIVEDPDGRKVELSIEQ